MLDGVFFDGALICKLVGWLAWNRGSKGQSGHDLDIAPELRRPATFCDVQGEKPPGTWAYHGLKRDLKNSNALMSEYTDYGT